MASRGSQSSIRRFFTSPGSSASMASTVSEIEGSKSDEQLDENLQSDKEAQSSELSSSEGSSDEIEQSAIEDRIGHGEVISVTDREILAKRRKIAHRRKGGVSPSWLKEFPWLRSVRGKNGKAGMRCHLCTKHSIVPRSGSTSWTSDPCFSVRKDKVVKHAKSQMHKQAEVMELQAGGIPRAFDEAYALEMKAAIGCCKCIYWLCKQEVSHTTTYPHLLSLAENLGCDYFKALNLGQNGKYTSPQIVTEFLDIINGVVEEEVLSDMKGSSSYSVMADESTDVSVLKQLVLYGRAVVKGIIDLSDGKAPMQLPLSYNLLVLALMIYPHSGVMGPAL